ncbi:MAG: YceI family protein [Planctomycetes bacterium]|nr:YceI family protein [Planctomycetota bacterium]
MVQKLLQWAGALFVVGLLGASVFALTIVKDRIRVVVAADEAGAGPDPMALLRDDLQTVSRTVDELRMALGGNFERLGAALEERAEARHADVQGIARDVTSVRDGSAAVQHQLASILARIEALEVRVQARGTGVAAAPVAAAEPPAAPVEKPVEKPVDPPAQRPAEQTPEKPAEKPAAKTGFLSFSVPTVAFRFDERQDYVLAPDLCRVGFDAKSTLHDFTGATSKVTGRFAADMDDPAGAWTGEVVCDATTLVTGVEGRDTNMYEHLDTKAHPKITFTITRFVPAEGGVDVGKQTARGEILGTMSIRGVQRELKMPVAIEVDASKRLVVKGQTPLKLSDYQVPVPSQLGLINMQDEVVVWVALLARVQTGGKK